MKKAIFLISMMFLLFCPVLVIAQGELPELPGGTDLAAYVATFLLYTASVMALTELVGTFIKKHRAVVSWVLAVLIGVLAFLLKFGIFADVWYVGLIYVAGGGAIVNGYISADTGQLLVDLLKQFIDKLRKPADE